MPTEADSCDSFCNSLQALLDSIVVTTFGEETFAVILKKVRKLGADFFYVHPWYNDQFAALLHDQPALLDVLRSSVRNPPGLCKVRSNSREKLAKSLETFLRRPVLCSAWKAAVPPSERVSIAAFFAPHGSIYLFVLATQI